MRVFGHEFEAGWVVLVIGTVGQLVNCATGSVGYLLLMSGNEKGLVRIQIIMAIITVTSCLLLVPHWGVAGAAIAAAVGNAGTNAWCLLEIKKSLRLFPYNRGYLSLVLPTAVTCAVAIGLRISLRSIGADIPVLIASTTCVYIFFIGTVLLLGLDADDRLIANAIWSRVRNYWLVFWPRMS